MTFQEIGLIVVIFGKDRRVVNTLKGRISIIYLLLVALSAVIGLTAVINLLKLNQSINGIMVDNYESIKVIARMQKSIERQDYAILKYVLSDNEQGIKDVLMGQNTFQEALTVENNNITEPGEPTLVKKLNSEYREYLELFVKLQEIKRLQGLNAAIGFNDSFIKSKSAEVRILLNKVAKLNERAMYRSKNRAISNAHQSLCWILIVSLGSVIIGFAIAKKYLLLYYLERLIF